MTVVGVWRSYQRYSELVLESVAYVLGLAAVHAAWLRRQARLSGRLADGLSDLAFACVLRHLAALQRERADAIMVAPWRR